MWSALLLLVAAPFSGAAGQEAEARNDLDARVRAFLDNRKGQWRSWNVPESDGRLLYDLIVTNNYTKALEIGTSTGHSAIWIAWALSKTGGRLVTIEIDEGRYRQALANFEAAGLSGYIDARLADAHQLVEELEGPFDFVFVDADKDGYTNYFKALYSKLEVGGCYTAHNVTQSGWGSLYGSGTAKFYAYVKSLPSMKTHVDDSGRGLSISYKITPE